VLVLAVFTAYTQKTVLEAAALEVILELPLDIPRQDRALGRKMGLERGIAFLDKLVKERSLRALALVTQSTDARTGFPASRQR
jgi:hypothetical protein